MLKPYNPNSEKIDDYINSKNERWQPLLYQIRDFILHSHPEMKEFYSYKVPFFGLQKKICYLNLRADFSCVDIGFLDGHLLEMEYSEISAYFKGKELKTIRHLKLGLDEWNDANMEKLNHILKVAICYCQGH